MGMIHRSVINASLWIDRTGAPWHDLPERYGPGKTVDRRFRRWRQAGVWDRVLAALQAAAGAAGTLDWALHFVDGTTVRTHQHAEGVPGPMPRPRHWGAAEAGFSPSCSCAPRVTASR